VQQQSKCLIVHADDLGMAHSVNRASFEAMDSRVCSSASVMVPCPWFPEVADYAAKHRDRDIGIHLTLTSEWSPYRWGPVAPVDTVRSLVDPDGFFWSDAISVADSAEVQEVEAELRAQINKAIEAGIGPTHLDSHMLALFSRQDLLSALERLAHEYSLPFLAVKAGDSQSQYGGLPLQTPVLDKLLTAKSSTDPKMWKAAYLRAVAHLGPGISELIVHLGFDDAELRSITEGRAAWGAAWRQRDFEVITSRDFRSALEARAVRLVGWRDVASMRPSGPRHGQAVERGLQFRSTYASCVDECGTDSDPGLHNDLPDAADWDWVARATTIDQLRIEAVLEASDLRGKYLLHVGIGNSSLAQRFAKMAAWIDGITISRAEKAHAESLCIPNYTVVVASKYDPAFSGSLPRKYDFIVDNNLSSYACCKKHFQKMMGSYARLLNPKGMILTDRRGMEWTLGDPRWKLTYHDLIEFGHEFDLIAGRVGSMVYFLYSQLGDGCGYDRTSNSALSGRIGDQPNGKPG
jgi:chitin disaccharide deacetylase